MKLIEACGIYQRFRVIFNVNKFIDIYLNGFLARFDSYIDGLKTYGAVSEGRAQIYTIV